MSNALRDFFMKQYKDIKNCEGGTDKKIMVKCKCGKQKSISAGDSIRDGKYLWYSSSHCEYCGESVEIDGQDIFDIPCSVKKQIINQEGEWGISAATSSARLKFCLKKILKEEYSDKSTSGESVLYTGTQNQIEWIKRRLIEKGIDEGEIKTEALIYDQCD